MGMWGIDNRKCVDAGIYLLAIVVHLCTRIITTDTIISIILVWINISIPISLMQSEDIDYILSSLRFTFILKLTRYICVNIYIQAHLVPVTFKQC